MNPTLMLKLCNEGKSLDIIANAGNVSLTEAMEFLKKSFPALNDDGQDNYGDIEWVYVPEVEKTPEDYCFAHDAYELRQER